MSVFKDYKNIQLDRLNEILKNTLSESLGMEVTELGENHLIMRMPVDHRTHQPFGVLNGGASMALAESAGSLAGNMCLPKDKYCVGLDINGNHIRAVREGFVYAYTSPIHLGSRTQVWEVKISDDNDKLVCIVRLTLAVLEKEKNVG